MEILQRCKTVWWCLLPSVAESRSWTLQTDWAKSLLLWSLRYFSKLSLKMEEIIGVWKGPSVGTPILGHGREVPRWWCPFWGFSIQLGPYFIPHHGPMDPPLFPLSVETNQFVSILFRSKDSWSMLSPNCIIEPFLSILY